MDKTYIRKSNVTLSEFRDQLKSDKVFNALTESQQNAYLNKASDRYNALSNNQGRSEYNFDCITDADLVLAPTASSYSNSFDKYLQIKFEAYDATADVVSGLITTAIDLSVNGTPTIDTSGGYAEYTIDIAGGTLNRHYRIEPPSPNYADVELVDSNTIRITAPLNHDEFSVLVKKVKET